MALNNKSTVWDFVEKYYPNYSSSDDIAFNNDLEKILHGELTGRAGELYNEMYRGHDNLLGLHYDESLLGIYEKSIKSYLESL